MKEKAFSRFAGAAAFTVGLSSLFYGLVFLLLVPAAQKPIGSGESLASFAANPNGRQIASILIAIGGLAATAAMVGIYRRVRDIDERWATWSLVLGVGYSLLTALHGVYITILFPILSGLYVHGDTATKAAAIVAANLPSPLDPFGFSKFFLSGIWLLVTGMLMLRTRYFARALAYLTLIAGIGVILLFIGSVTQTQALILATGLPGSAVIGPLFWLWTGYTLWRKE